jgi:hypothetical protein
VAKKIAKKVKSVDKNVCSFHGWGHLGLTFGRELKVADEFVLLTMVECCSLCVV